MEWSEFGAYNLSECVPSILRRVGFETAVFTGGALNNHAIRPNDIDAMGFGRAVGYEQLVGSNQMLEETFDHVNHLGVEDEAIIEPAVAWAKQQVSKPFFLGVFTVTTHAPYELPSRFKPSFVVEKDTPKNVTTQLWSIQTSSFNAFLRSFNRLVFLILCSLLLVTMERCLASTSISAWSSLHEEALRVPLVIVGPDTGPPGTPIEGLRSLLDVAPTVIRWVGVDIAG